MNWYSACRKPFTGDVTHRKKLIIQKSHAVDGINIALSMNYLNKIGGNPKASIHLNIITIVIIIILFVQ